MLHYSIMIRANSCNLTCMVQVVSLGVILPPLNTEENVVKRFHLLFYAEKAKISVVSKKCEIDNCFWLGFEEIKEQTC